MSRSAISKSTIALLFGACIGLAHLPGPAFAARRPPPEPQAGSDIREGRFVLAPMAYIAFCNRYKDDCPKGGGPATLTLDTETDALLRRVNADVNASVAPVQLSGQDIWQLGLAAGHCAIYAVQKRHDLIEAGLPAAALSLAVVSTPQGIMHLVVAVRTDRGVVLLDNLRSSVVPWNQSGYLFHMVQSRDNPDFWVTVSGSQPVAPPALVASRRTPQRGVDVAQVTPPVPPAAPVDMADPLELSLRSSIFGESGV